MRGCQVRGRQGQYIRRYVRGRRYHPQFARRRQPTGLEAPAAPLLPGRAALHHRPPAGDDVLRKTLPRSGAPAHPGHVVYRKEHDSNRPWPNRRPISSRRGAATTGRLRSPPTRPTAVPSRSAASKTSTFRASSPIFPRTSTPRSCTFLAFGARVACVGSAPASARELRRRAASTCSTAATSDHAALRREQPLAHGSCLLVGPEPLAQPLVYVLRDLRAVHGALPLEAHQAADDGADAAEGELLKGRARRARRALGSEDAVARMLECGESLREPSKRT